MFEDFNDGGYWDKPKLVGSQSHENEILDLMADIQELKKQKKEKQKELEALQDELDGLEDDITGAGDTLKDTIEKFLN